MFYDFYYMFQHCRFKSLCMSYMFLMSSYTQHMLKKSVEVPASPFRQRLTKHWIRAYRKLLFTLCHTSSPFVTRIQDTFSRYVSRYIVRFHVFAHFLDMSHLISHVFTLPLTLYHMFSRYISGYLSHFYATYTYFYVSSRVV